MEGPHGSKAVSDLFRHAQGRENKSSNFPSDAPFNGLEDRLEHLLGAHFPGHTNLVEEGGEHILGEATTPYRDYSSLRHLLTTVQ